MNSELDRRKHKIYTESEQAGLRQVAEILKQTRLSQEGKIGTRKRSSVRGFIELLEEKTGERFNISDIQRYEAAGEPDKRYGFINAVHPTYLECVAPLTSYTVEELKEMMKGNLTQRSPSPSQDVLRINTQNTQAVMLDLSPSLMHFIEKHKAMYNYQSMSQVIETALEEWRDRELEKAYREASAEVDGDWDVVVADGLTDEAW
ncbi:MAG: hypothetical protein SFY66_24925 [Oculatellaceae cyanobacterium bins.114]|nr:hypothetical protein [Oculatellaceae cyanobacterium bins.114]